MASKKASKKGFSRIAAIALVLFILLVIILVAARGRSRYGSSGGSIDFTNPQDLLDFTRDLDTFNEMEALAARVEEFRQGTIQSPLQQFV
ncbi:hypothetical protein [Chengkuizengella sediminis]|uniref:hypothetical protein n=1 Tax=Chengkuizengella sediminis TaxID=1885917 RepID=UPI00138A5072|nr:hypothetical protein [Chengkuizengella sediminis]NDI37190.1 hypothetical protein [Chengkuizengella sediminis]